MVGRYSFFGRFGSRREAAGTRGRSHAMGGAVGGVTGGTVAVETRLLCWRL